MTAPFAAALLAAKAAAGQQHYPQGALYAVATPIGNLADISLRALQVLGLVDAIACEDTRHTRGLLHSYGIATPGSLIALHRHNELEGAQQVIAHLQAGERVAYVSDAGTPAVSDPGARLCAAVQAAGLRVVPLPGASSVTALLSVAGAVDGDDRRPGFRFVGFLPLKAQARDEAVQALATEPQAVVLLEAPHRIVALAASLAALGTRRLTVGRELTKQFEQIVTLPAIDLAAWLAADPHRERGEFALLLHPQSTVADASLADADRALALLLPELPLKTAVRIASEWTGQSRNVLYARALQRKADTPSG